MPWNYSKSIDISPEGFLALAHHCARKHHADLLLSGPGFDGEHVSRIGLFPKRDLIISSTTQLAEIKNFCFNHNTPCIGWFAYELGMRLRGVRPAVPTPLPQGHLKQYEAMISYDARQGECTVSSQTKSALHAAADLASSAPTMPTDTPPVDLGVPIASMNRQCYEAAVADTLEFIRDGQVYQLNLSIQFEHSVQELDALALFFTLFRRYPAPFYAWFRSDDYRILSTSPERFLRVNGDAVLSQPIKGTRVMADGSDESTQRAALLGSDKEQAELSMIVDLIRNDISHHCEYGSVQVEHHRQIARVDNLLQMYSNVRGTLRPGATCLDLLFDALPGGSITGCPKHRAMQLIDALEPHSRGVYCGTMVFIEDEHRLDSSICIRTAVHDTVNKRLLYHAGSGIVIDSDPASEYKETMAKAGKFLKGGEW